MSSVQFFAAVSTALALAGGPAYFFDILRRRTKPERVTWFVWSLQGLIAFTGQAILGGGWSLVFIGMNAAGNLIVFLLALKFGVGGWKPIDKTALAIALAGLAASVLVREPVVALLGVIAADFAGTVPTFFKVYRMPESETTFTWLSFATASVLAIFSIGSFKWSLIIYPLYLALDNYAIVVFQYLGKAKLASKGRRSARRSTKSRRRQPALR